MDNSSENENRASSSTIPSGLRSEVYKHFIIKSKDSRDAVCKQCNKIVSRGGQTEGSYNTTNLWAHIKKCNPQCNEDKDRQKTDLLESPGSPQQADQASSPQLSLSSQSLSSRSPVSQPNLESPLSQPLEGDIADQMAGGQRNDPPSLPKKVIVPPSSKKGSTKWPVDSPKSIEITNAIAKMIVSDFQPFSIVENPGFKNLLAVLVPNYEIPSRKTYTKKKIPDMYQRGQDFLKYQVKLEMVQGSITTDLWSSVSGDSYLSLTLHYITQGFAKREITIGVTPFDKTHDGEHISETILTTLKSWDLGIQNIVAAVHDNGPNVCCGVRVAGLLSVRCANHTLQLTINTDSLDKNEELTALITNVKAVVAHFHRSSLSRGLLYNAQILKKLKHKKLLQDNQTRWNSTYYMIKRFSEQGAAIKACLPQTKCIVEITNEDWKLVDRLVQVLEPFEEVTKLLEREESALSEVIPLITTLRDGVVDELFKLNDPAIDKLLEYLKKSLDERFIALIIDSRKLTTHMIATILDPRFKMEGIRDYVETSIIKERIIEFMAQENPSEEEHKLEVVDSNAPPKKAMTKQNIWGKYIEIQSPKTVKNMEGGYSFQTELDIYLREPCLPITANPLNFWKTQYQSYPRLARLARKYLSIPPGSSTSERVFSTAGNVVTKRRSNLNPDMVNRLVFLNRNYRYLKDIVLP